MTHEDAMVELVGAGFDRCSWLTQIQKSEPLSSFSRNTPCPKCGCKMIENKYNSHDDVMVSKCPCGYTWRSAPLDRKADNQ